MNLDMKMYGYEQYALVPVSSYFFCDKSSWSSNFLSSGYYVGRGSKYVRMLTDDNPLYKMMGSYSFKNEAKKNEFIKSRIYVPQEGETLYFDKGCTIPRANCEQKWKRTIKLINADVVVVPEPTPIDVTENSYIFEDKADQTLYWIRDSGHDVKVKPYIGETMRELIDANKKSMKPGIETEEKNAMAVHKANDSVCIFIGDISIYGDKDCYIFDIIDGIYPRIIFEQDLLKELDGLDNKFDVDNMESLKVLLSSTDKESVHYGMRVLANMDYMHFPSIAKYILTETENNWNRFRPYNRAVNFMLKALHCRTYEFHNPFSGVTAEEFDLAHDIFIAIVRENVQRSLQNIRSRTNLEVKCNLDIDVSLPKPAEALNADDVEYDESEDEENTD